jgi:ribosomal peptide maturation radical SAM protein 1
MSVAVACAPVSCADPAAAAFRVALVFMPFASADRPSIQLGLLKAIAERAGFPTDCHHLNLNLAARIPEAYDGLCTFRGAMTGEWLFSLAAFDELADSDDEVYFAAFPSEIWRAAKAGKDGRYLSHLRRELLPAFIDECLRLVDWQQYSVVGFSSTFQQNVASLALARRIKERFPDIVIVFGGANMEGEMGVEYARAFDFLNYVVIGEGDRAFPALLAALRDGNDLSRMPGLAYRRADGTQVHTGQAPPERDLNSLPTPDYDEFFARFRELGLSMKEDYLFALPFESSRGCWWGEKHHCTFCGLNGLGMGFRSKSPDIVLRELTHMVDRYGVTMFQATDNILDMKYVEALFAKIRETRTDYEFFYEVKSNLTQAQLRTLRQGGVRWIQPGIESFSTPVLRLMRKGCTMLQNVRLLKWAKYYRIRVGWNLLWGFPGEREEYYRAEYEILRLLGHLEPPNMCGRIWLERFSPIFFDRERFPALNLRPAESYGLVYPPGVDLAKIAYFYDGDLQDTAPEVVHEPTAQLVADWQRDWNSDRPSSLLYRRTLDALTIEDNRWNQPQGSHTLTGPLALAYEFCSETMRSARQIACHISAAGGDAAFDEEEVAATLDSLCRRGLMLVEDGGYFSLALPANRNW